MWRASLCLVVAAISGASAEAAPLRAGIAVIDVTPEQFPVIVNGMFTERTATAAHDRLSARALVLDDGSTTVAIVVVDSCMMPRELLDRAKAMASKATGIPTANMLISATHTHSAPAAMGCLGSDADPVYPGFLEAQIARAITQATAKRVPARVGWVVTPAPDHTHNRRWILRSDRVRADPFGNPTVRANMHPGYQNPDFVGPSGPVDSELSLLSVQTADGRPLAVLANYSMHYFGSPIVSADYFGLFRNGLEKRLAGSSDARPMVMMSQGTSGDLMWMDYGKPKPTTALETYSDELAALAFAALGKVEYAADVPLAMREATMPLDRRTPSAERLQWAEKLVPTFKDRKPTTQPEIYAREAVFLHNEPRRELKLQAVRIGGFGLAAIPNEVFAISGLRIKASSPLTPTAVIELANGAEGYIPPPAQHVLGGYTTWPARTAALEVQAEPKIVEMVVRLLEDVAGAKRRPYAEPAAKYADVVRAAKPLAYWRFGEFHGPTATDETGAHPGTYEDGVAYFLDGAVGRCAHFTGGRLTAELKDLGPAYTATAWIWNGLPADARPVTGYLFSRGPDGAKEAPGDHLGIGGTHSHTGKLIAFNGNARNECLGGRTVIEPRTWHHVAMVRDGRSVVLYLDGAEETHGEMESTMPAGCGSVFVGGRCDRFAGWEGKLDEVAVFGRALSAAEIASLARSR